MPHSSNLRNEHTSGQPLAPATSPGAAASGFLSNAAQLAAAIANEAPLAWVSCASTSTATAWALAGSALAGLAPSPALQQAVLRAGQATEVFPAQPGSDHPAIRAGLKKTAAVRQCNSQPLRSAAGHLLGVLCVCHTAPTPLSPAQRGQLALLAQQLAAYIELGQPTARPLPLADAPAGWPGQAPPPEPTTLFVKQEQRLLRLLLAEIHCVEALGDYVNIHTTTARLTVYTTMKEMEGKLPRRVFARVHRKYIVRLDRILHVEGDTIQLDTIQLDISRAPALLEVPIGSSYKAALLGRLNVV